MNPISLFASSLFTSSVLLGFLPVTGLVIVLLALGGIIVALYIAVPPVTRAIDRRMYSPQQLRKEASYYQLIEFEPPAPPVPRRPPHRPVWDVGQPMRLGGMGLVVLAQGAEWDAVNIAGTILAIFVVLFFLALVRRDVANERHQPLQRTFDEYLNEVRRESRTYLDNIRRLYRNQ